MVLPAEQITSAKEVLPMSNQSTVDTLRAMRFSGMAAEFERQMKDLSSPEYTDLKTPAGIDPLK